MLNVAVHRTLVLQPSHLTSFMFVPVLVNISVPNPPLCQFKLSLQLDPAKQGAVHIHVERSSKNQGGEDLEMLIEFFILGFTIDVS